MDRREWMLRMAGLGLLAKSSVGGDVAKVWRPQFFSIEQNRTIIALGERIVPGSAQASCNRLIDLVMPIETDKNKRDFLECLNAFDREAKNRHGKRFSELDATAQDEILGYACAQSSSLHSEFQLMKEWIADAYWSSQRGLAELGSTGRMAWQEFPGCPSPRAHN